MGAAQPGAALTEGVLAAGSLLVAVEGGAVGAAKAWGLPGERRGQSITNHPHPPPTPEGPPGRAERALRVSTQQGCGAWVS